MWARVIDRSGTYDLIEIIGTPDDSSKAAWQATVSNGLLITASDVTIRHLKLSRLHVGVEIRGDNVTIESWEADLLSGDVFQGNGSNPSISNGIASNLIEVLPYERYHPDIVHFRAGDGGLVDGVEVVTSDHKWARKNYQGVMFSDNAFRGWVVRNLKFPGVHSEHAVTFAEAHDCCVHSVWGGGAIRFRALSGKPSTGCIAFDVDGPVEGVDKMNEIEASILNGESLPRGIRNRNPGNVERNNANDWLGLAKPEQMTKAQKDETRFCVFTDEQYGIRALVILLLNYQRRYRLTSIHAMLSRYAPRQDKNDTDAYIAFVAARVGVQPKQKISVSDYQTCFRLVEAIIHHENGMQPYPAETIREGIGLAGIAVDTETAASDVKPKIASTENIAVATTVTGTGGIATLEWIKSQVAENAQLLDGLTTQSKLQIALLVAILVSQWYLAWRRGEASFLGIR